MPSRKKIPKNVLLFILLLVIALGVTTLVNNTFLETTVSFDKIRKNPLQTADLQKELISLIRDIANKYITWSTVILGFILLNCFIKSESEVLLSSRNSFLIPFIFVFFSASLFYGISMINELAKLIDKGKVVTIPVEPELKTDLIRSWDFTVGWFNLGFLFFVVYLFLIVINALKKD